jgi:hypothetical protein
MSGEVQQETILRCYYSNSVTIKVTNGLETVEVDESCVESARNATLRAELIV